jgi:solute carrier family 25 phosphate transporter 23/24/25/41
MAPLENGKSVALRNVFEDEKPHFGPRTSAANNMADTPRKQPMAAFSMAIRSGLCSHAEYFYFNQFYMSKCIKELQQMQQIIDDQLAEHAAVLEQQQKASGATSGLWWRHLLAGGAAGAVSRTCTAPLDRLKCMLQVYGSRTNNMRFGAVLRHMLEEGGVSSMWRGNAINVVKVVPEMAIKFMAYEQIKRLLMSGTGNRDLGIAERFIAGSLAGALAQSIIYPLEVLKTRLVLRKTGQYSGALDCAVNIIRHEGVRGFYRGYLPNMIGILPYAGIDLAIYETLKRRYMSRCSSSDAEPGTTVLIVCGVISSSCGQLASYPLQLVRTRLQANVTVDGEGCATMSNTFRAILSSDGFVGLYRGIAANFLKVAPAVSLSYVVYEKTRGMLGAKMT